MKIKSLICILILSIVSCNAAAAFSTAGGYVSSVVYTGAGSVQPTMNGLAYDSGSLYLAQGTDLVTVDTANNSSQVTGNMPGAMFNSLVSRYGGTTYTSYSSFPNTMDYTIGYIDAGGAYQAQTTITGIYDMAINSAGDAYIVADPTGAGQSQILKYDLTTGTATAAATIGGYSGGLAFDSAGNLYYADQGEFGGRAASVLKFSVDGSGAVDMSSPQSVLGIGAGFIGFDADDNFYATTGWGAAFSQYDLSTGSLVADIAYGGIGQFEVVGESIYLLDTDWDVFASTVYEVTVPEPATIAMLGLGAFGLVRRKRA